MVYFVKKKEKSRGPFGKQISGTTFIQFHKLLVCTSLRFHSKKVNMLSSCIFSTNNKIIGRKFVVDTHKIMLTQLAKHNHAWSFIFI